MSSQVKIKKENRKSLSLKAAPGELVALIPRGLDEESEEVKRFIEQGIGRLKRINKPFLAVNQRWTKSNVEKRVFSWGDKLGVKVKRIQLRRMKRIWASCSTEGNLTLDKEILSLPEEFIDFIICHELLHVKVPYHNKLFKSLLSSYIPNYEAIEKSLILAYL